MRQSMVSVMALWVMAGSVASCGGDAGTAPSPDPVTGSVRGSAVEDNNAPVSGVSVQLSRSGQPSRSASTGSDGMFAFPNVTPGAWQVVATPPSGYAAEGATSASVEVTANAQATVPPFVLRRTGPGGSDVTVVSMVDNSFTPNAVTVPTGRVVRWLNTGGTFHNATGAGGAWTTGDLAPGSNFERQFNEVGTFAYECTLHPGMTGTVTVQ